MNSNRSLLWAKWNRMETFPKQKQFVKRKRGYDVFLSISHPNFFSYSSHPSNIMDLFRGRHDRKKGIKISVNQKLCFNILYCFSCLCFGKSSGSQTVGRNAPVGCGPILDGLQKGPASLTPEWAKIDWGGQLLWHKAHWGINQLRQQAPRPAVLSCCHLLCWMGWKALTPTSSAQHQSD